MLLHEIKQKNPNKAKQPRIARGGKRGHTSGRGQKGQKSRSGHRIRPAERDFIMRLPKQRGYRYGTIHEKPQTIDFRDLNKLTTSGEINPQVLHDAGLIKNPKKPVKLLNNGSPIKKMLLSGVLMSKQAKTKLEK